MELQIGQQVYIEDTAEPDATILAWQHIKHHRVGTVIALHDVVENDLTGRERIVAVEWSDPFQGGHACNYMTKPNHGQYFAAKNLRPVEYMDTVPNIVMPKAINVTQPGHA